MICLLCGKNEAIYNEYYGYLPCTDCVSRSAKRDTLVGGALEMVGASILDQRKAHAQDIRPAHRKGSLDLGFVERYGAKKAKEQGFTDQEIKESKYVWDQDEYYKK